MSVPVGMSWSGGKDSALARNSLRQSGEFEVVALLTTLTREYDRIAMHGVRRELLVAQAESICLPLAEAWITAGAGSDEYESAMSDSFSQFRDAGVSTIAFGDLFLQDVRKYRGRLVERLDMTSIFPMWMQDTTALAREFVEVGFRAKTCCVDTTSLPELFCGRDLTCEFFRDLPAAVDPCGENGEFHSFVYDGPMFSKPIDVCTGDMRRDGPFVFRDIVINTNRLSEHS